MSHLETAGENVPSLVNHICKKYNKLSNRLQQLQPKRNRRIITYLAQPKYETPKFRRPSQCNVLQKMEIIRDAPVLTRTEQLAYPRVRNLLPVKREFQDIFDAQRLMSLNSTLRKSMLSLYSRLANIQIPKETQHIAGWTKVHWTEHTKYLKKLAQPKKIFKPTRQKHMWKDIKYLKRYKSLCTPKKSFEPLIPKSEPTSRHYKLTARILHLSKPKEIDENFQSHSLSRKINQGALNYKATERIKQLSIRAKIRLGESDLKENPFTISLNALKAKPSDRIVELSQPKEYHESHTKDHPFVISKAARKAKASPRIIELSKPRELS